MAFATQKPKFELSFQMENPAIGLAMQLRRSGKSERQIANALLGEGFGRDEILDATGVDLPGEDSKPALPSRATEGEDAPSLAPAPPRVPRETAPDARQDPAQFEYDDGDGRDPELPNEADEYTTELDIEGLGKSPPLLGASSWGSGDSSTSGGGDSFLGGLTPEPGTMAKLMGMFSPDSASGQALLAAGLGMLGARGTRGDLGAAISQGGMAGFDTYQRAKRQEGIDSYRKDLVDQSRKKLAADVAESAAKQQSEREQRLLSKFTQIREVAKNDPQEGQKLYAADKGLQKLFGVPFIEFSNGPMSWDDVKVQAYFAADPATQRKMLAGGGEGGDGGDTPTKIKGRLLSRKLAGESLSPTEELLIADEMTDPYVSKAAQILEEMKLRPEGRALRKMGSEQYVARLREVADNLRRGSQGDASSPSVPAPAAKSEHQSFLDSLGAR